MNKVCYWSVNLILSACAMVTGAQEAQNLRLSPKQLQQIEAFYGQAASLKIQEWQLLLQQLPTEFFDDSPKMAAANGFFNAVPWVTDAEHWGVEDYWATPVEMLATNGGDCEDFSIAKYFTLKGVGVERAKLRITYVKALEFNQAHMVLAYYPNPGDEPLILDNINQQIVPASERTDLVPVYSFNGDGLWLAQARGRQLSANSEGSLPNWRAVNERLQQQLKGN